MIIERDSLIQRMKPPLGVMPRGIWMEQRAQDLTRAIRENIEVRRYAVVKPWLLELHGLCGLLEAEVKE